jgi:NADH dehydrogenase [ubiquinone] 1 alpha subcomplex assembly factor 7
MTPLAKLLATRIQAAGPITLGDYMSDCLIHPDHGYYTTRNSVGLSGDFITGPEISQMFGELVALSLAQAWLDQGSPTPFVLAELGPGRGTLMADFLRAARAVPGFAEAAQVYMVEASPRLRAAQRKALGDRPVTWFDRFEDLPQGPLFVIANEFFDALPIRQFMRQERGWAECLVGLDGDRLYPGMGPEMPVAALDHRLADTYPGDIVEIGLASEAVAADLGARIAAQGGAALIIDYGGWHSLGDTFQAMANHDSTDPFAAPGEADLTAHVDFEALAMAAHPCAYAYVTQGEFLNAMGIATRTERLAKRLTGSALDMHLDASRRLTDPSEMGTLFKVLALHPVGTPPLPGTES